MKYIKAKLPNNYKEVNINYNDLLSAITNIAIYDDYVFKEKQKGFRKDLKKLFKAIGAEKIKFSDKWPWGLE